MARDTTLLIEAFVAYYPDLTEYQYSYSVTERRYNGLPLVSIGWMEPPHPLRTGDAPPGFAERLAAFCARDKLVNLLCGHQDCAFCGATYHQFLRRTGSPLGNGEIRVLGDGVVYAAPSLICHYVAAHSYLPPPEFVDAVMHGPGPDHRSYIKYRFHCLEAATDPGGFYRTGPAGSIFGPLVWRYRGMAWLAITMFAIACVRLGGFLVTAAILVGLGMLFWYLRTRLRCPVCRKRMTLPFRELADWSIPPASAWERPWSTFYCLDCGVGLHTGTDLWGDPVCEVVTT
jgi:hypothetical protein